MSNSVIEPLAFNRGVDRKGAILYPQLEEDILHVRSTWLEQLPKSGEQITIQGESLFFYVIEYTKIAEDAPVLAAFYYMTEQTNPKDLESLKDEQTCRFFWDISIDNHCFEIRAKKNSIFDKVTQSIMDLIFKTGLRASTRNGEMLNTNKNYGAGHINIDTETAFPNPIDAWNFWMIYHLSPHIWNEFDDIATDRLAENAVTERCPFPTDIKRLSNQAKKQFPKLKGQANICLANPSPTNCVNYLRAMQIEMTLAGNKPASESFRSALNLGGEGKERLEIRRVRTQSDLAQYDHQCTIVTLAIQLAQDFRRLGRVLFLTLDSVPKFQKMAGQNTHVGGIYLGPKTFRELVDYIDQNGLFVSRS